jgi:hypothetical protein
MTCLRARDLRIKPIRDNAFWLRTLLHRVVARDVSTKMKQTIALQSRQILEMACHLPRALHS